jgi:outer membrane protein assembly factor BamB
MGDGVIFLTAWPYALLNDASRKGFLYAVDPESGKAKWVTSVDGLGITAPTTAKGLVFFAVKEGPRDNPSPLNREKLYAINAADGQVKWKFDAEGSYGTPQLLIAASAMHFSTEKSLFALEMETGRQLWSFGAEDIRASLQADAQHVYLITQKDSLLRPNRALHALAFTTGQEKWSRDLSWNAHTVMVHDGVVYGGIGPLRAIDAATGNVLWSFKGTGRESARLISGGRIFLTSPTVTYIQSTRVDQGYLYAIDAKTGKLNP